MQTFTGDGFEEHLRKCNAPYLAGNFSALLRASRVCGLRPVLLLDALNECPTPHENALLTGVQEFLLHSSARLIGTSQVVPTLTGELQSEFLSVFLPAGDEKVAIYAYHAGVPVSSEIKHLCESFTNAYDLAIAGRCYSKEAKPQSRVDLYDRYVRHSLPKNTVVISTFLRSIAQEMSASLSLAMRRVEFVRKAELFFEEQKIALSDLDGMMRSRLLGVSEDFISFEHELLFDYFRAEAILRQFPEIPVLCKELKRPRNHELFELVLPRFAKQNELEQLLEATSSISSLCRVMQGWCGPDACVVLVKKCAALLDLARQDLANITLKCSVVIQGEGKLRLTHVEIENNFELSKGDQGLCAVIARHLDHPALKDRFLALLDETESSLRYQALVAARKANLKATRLWEEVVRYYGGALSWGSSRLVYTAITGSIHNTRMTLRHSPGVLPIVNELKHRAFSDKGSHFALHLLEREWQDEHESNDIDAKIKIAQLGLDSGVGIVQLDAVDLLRSMVNEMGDATEVQRQQIRETLAHFEPNDVIMNSIKMEVLASYGDLELLVTVEEAIAEMRTYISSAEPSADLLEIAELSSLNIEEYRKQAAYGCLAKIFEDIFQGVYWDAYYALNTSEKMELLCLAGMSKQCGFASDWIVSELHQFDAVQTVPVYGRWAHGVDFESFSHQEAVACFILAIQGWAKSESEPPAYRPLISIDDEAWKGVGEILFWHFHQPQSEAAVTRIRQLWNMLSERTPNAVPDVLYQLYHSQWKVCDSSSPLRIDLHYSEVVRPLLERALSNCAHLTSLFPHGGGVKNRELIVYLIVTLGHIGVRDTINTLTDWIENTDFGKPALKAIASIRSRTR